MTHSTRICSVFAVVLAACSQPATVADDELPDAAQVARVDAAIENPRPPPDAGVAPDAAVPPDGCVQQISQLLVNPAFDEMPAGKGWTQTLIDADSPLVTDADGVTEQTPALKAWLGGIEAPLLGTTVKDTLVQDVVIPANTTSLVLTGFYDVRTGETSTTAFDTARLVVTKTDGTTIATVLSLSNLTPKTTWTTFAHAFSQNLSGQTVRIRITSTNDELDPTSFFFDSLSLLATRNCGSVTP